MKNPRSVFVTPEALSESTELTAQQKHAVLLQWKDQLQQLQAADDEGMRQNAAIAGRTDDLLGRVTSSLADRLGEGVRLAQGRGQAQLAAELHH